MTRLGLNHLDHQVAVLERLGHPIHQVVAPGQHLAQFVPGQGGLLFKEPFPDTHQGGQAEIVIHRLRRRRGTPELPGEARLGSGGRRRSRCRTGE